MRTDIYKLDNQIKHYEWGSSEMIPQFLGIANNRKKPYAEMWMGTHSLSPSQILRGGSFENLSNVAGELPFLFKLIAVQKPLSIQAHPNKKQAEEGYDREESQGLSLKNPVRNYKDNNHKPEILCALTPFTLMAGFREPDVIYKSFKMILSTTPQLKEIISPLLSALENGSLRDFFRLVSGLSNIEREYLASFIFEKELDEKDTAITPAQWKLMKSLASQYPRDIAVISPLYLNILTLKTGQAVYIPSGTLHAYISGFGVELMANSDNVLRGGLTPKHIDLGELMNILYFVPFMPQIITPSSGTPWFCYHTPCTEFLLAFMNSNGEKTFPEKGPAICLVTEGKLETCGVNYKKGDSFFVPKKEDASFSFNGNFSLFAACAVDEVKDKDSETL